MARLIPSTTVLITFEAAVRLGGFSRAAEELCLTESAVSKQISKLEAQLGVKFFDRAHGRLALSAAGEAYARDIRRLLDSLEASSRAVVESHRGRKELKIAALPTFANRWLLPRLKSFSSLNGDVVVNISACTDSFVFHESEFDAAVYFDGPRCEGVRKQTLFSEELVAVVSPRHFEAGSWAGDVASIPLLHKATRQDAWQRWFDGARLHHPAPMAGPHYDSFANLIEAVRSGMGVSLVPRLYVERELETGELVQPYPHTLRNEKTYIIILPDHDPFPAALQAFVDWLMSEAQQFRDRRSAEDAAAARLLPGSPATGRYGPSLPASPGRRSRAPA